MILQNYQPYIMKIHLANESAMFVLGQAIATAFPQGGIIFLKGELGAGKTTLVKTILRSLGHTGAVKSPTYTLVEPYRIHMPEHTDDKTDNHTDRDIYHFDLYRLGDPEELEYIGIRDYLHQHALCLIEWPERATGYLPEADMLIHLNYCEQGKQGRNLKIEGDQHIKKDIKQSLETHSVKFT